MASCRKCGTDEIDLICEGCRWTPVEDGLPDEGDDILFILEFSEDIVFRGGYFSDIDYPWVGQSRIHTDKHAFSSRIIRCWMKIEPPTPREELDDVDD